MQAGVLRVLRQTSAVGVFPVLIACGVRHSKIFSGLYIKALRIANFNIESISTSTLINKPIGIEIYCDLEICLALDLRNDYMHC